MLRTLTLTVAAIIVSAAFAIAVATLPAADAETPPQIVSLRAVEGELSGSTTTTAAPTTTTTVPPTTTTVPPTTTTTAAPALPPPPPVMQPAGSCYGWIDLVTAHFPADQVSTACRVIGCESGGNPGAQNRTSTASGIGQFLDGTWITTTGLAPPASAYAPAIQIEAMATLWSRSGWSPWSCY